MKKGFHCRSGSLRKIATYGSQPAARNGEDKELGNYSFSGGRKQGPTHALNEAFSVG
jgi:hypothetical protein